MALVLAVLGFTPPASHPPPASQHASSLILPSTSPLMMPQSPFPAVPKAYRVPEQTADEWIDGHDALYRNRLCYLGQEIDDLVINQIISMMLFLDAEDETKPINLYVNSPGGSVIAGLALYDTMQHIGSEVMTVNVGMAASMASFILGAGSRGKRLALPKSRVMIHQPMGGSEGQAEDVRVEAEQIYKIKATLVTMYAEMTGQTREQIEKDLGHDNYMSAQEACDYGLIDALVPSVDTSL